jgi:hypothetical protein
MIVALTIEVADVSCISSVVLQKVIDNITIQLQIDIILFGIMAGVSGPMTVSPAFTVTR